MSTSCKLIFILSFLTLAFGSAHNKSIYTADEPITYCSDAEVKDVDKCFENVPPLKFNGIPSSPEKIDNICRLFYSAMECIDNLSRTCLAKEGQKLIKASIIGAIEFYKILCTDDKFRADYLQHSNCYQRISPSWDNCNQKFINTLKIINHAEDLLSLCCLRLRYFKCTNDTARILCSKEAVIFLQSITKLLMNSPLEAYQSSQCDRVDRKNCTRFSSSGLSISLTGKISPILIIINLILGYFMKSALNLFTMPHD